ncbi:hypothetical protein ARSEF4850_000929 [Beauveria asiatica]
MQAANHLRNVFAAGKQAMGMWQMIPGANVSRILANSGVDWVVVDCEHGNIDDRAMHDAVPAIAALGVSPIVRIPDMHGWMVKRALDAGAHGILVPMLRSAAQAREVVQSAKFPPGGNRGFGSPIALSRFSPVPSFTEYLQQANDVLLTMVQIETQEALDEVEEIAAVPGVDVLFVGPFDLGNNIGHPILNGVVSDELKAAIARILQATHKAGKKCGMYCANGAQAQASVAQGFDMINVATDYTSLQTLVQEELSVASSQAKPERGVSY